MFWERWYGYCKRPNNFGIEIYLCYTLFVFVYYCWA
ncbi:hypothetical protein EMIT0196MI5_160123 [Pseudomonas sp. IT-196MI5]